MDQVCNYALLRFMPCRDADEFVNVGVAVVCEESALLDYRLETQNPARLSIFFPNLDVSDYQSGALALGAEIDRWKMEAANPQSADVTPRRAFCELTRRREGVFAFGPTRTLLSANPANVAEDMFQRYVRPGANLNVPTTPGG